MLEPVGMISVRTLHTFMAACLAAFLLASCGRDEAPKVEAVEQNGQAIQDNADAGADQPEALADGVSSAIRSPDPASQPAPEAALPEEVGRTVDPMAPLVGMATAVESAVLEMNGTRVMLYGVESVHPPQTCRIGGETWECWPAAVRQLQTFLAEQPVTCRPVEQPDYMGRVLALCEQGGASLNERYVRSGFGLAIEKEMPEYAAAEAQAKAERIGLWQGTFQEPSEWRADQGIEVIRP